MATPTNTMTPAFLHHTSTSAQLQFTLVQPPFGFILQFTPQTAFLISKNNYHDSNILYGVYRPSDMMPGNYYCVGYSRVTNFEQEQMGRGVMRVINLELDQVGRHVMQVMILKLQPLALERDGSGIADMTNADFEAIGDLLGLSNEMHNPDHQVHAGDASPSTLVQPFLDLNMPPLVQPLDLNMPPAVQHLDLNMPDPPVQPLDLNMPPPVQPLDLNMTPMEEDDDHSFLVPVPEEEVAMTGITLDSVLNIFTSHYDRTYEENIELEEQMGRVGSRLSEETIMQHLQITKYASTTRGPSAEPDICVICQVEFANDECIGGLPCGHKYHVECIKTWLQRSNNCPLCKATAVS